MSVATCRVMAALALMWFALASLGLAGDVDVTLTAEAKADAEAADKADCWCKEISELLRERSSNADSEIQYLSTRKEVTHWENVRLRQELHEQEVEAKQHEDSLGEATSIRERRQTDHVEDAETHEAAIASIKEAMAVLPKTSDGEEHPMRGVLHNLEDTFSRNMEHADASHKRRQDAMSAAMDAKAEMLRLAHEGAKNKQSRLADGLADVERTGARSDAYQAQHDADHDLSLAMNSLCKTLADDAQVRITKRQAVSVAMSQAEVAKAEAESRKISSKLVLMSRIRRAQDVAGAMGSQATGLRSTLARAAQKVDSGDTSGAAAILKQLRSDIRKKSPDERHVYDPDAEEDCIAQKKAIDSVKGAKQSAANLVALIKRSQEIEGRLASELKQVELHAHNAGNSGSLSAGVKAAIGEYATVTKEHLGEMPHLFNEVRSKALVSDKADQKVVNALMSAKDYRHSGLAEECDDMLRLGMALNEE